MSTTKIRANKFAATCAACNNRVAEAAGSLTNEAGKWIVRHLDGQCPAAAAPAVRAIFPDLSALPVSKFMIDLDGKTIHVEIVERRGGRRFLNLLVGAPGDWARERVTSARQHRIVAALQEATYWDEIGARQASGPEAAALRFSREHRCCAACMSPLSDMSQPGYKIGFGPVCVKRFL